MNDFKKTTLTNGLTLITVPMPQVESVTAMLMVGAGSRYETKDINGLSHFLEHMAFKGSKKRPTAQEISGTIDAIGGEFNAFTGKDHTGFYIKARVKHLELLLDVISDMVLNPLLKKEEIEREKGVITEEINMYKDTPMRHIADVFENLLFGDVPLGWDTAGESEIIKTIKRENFVTYLDGLYRPNNAVLIIAGGIGNPSTSLGTNSQSSIENLIKKYFSDWKKSKTWQFEKVSDNQSSPQLKIEFKDTQQAHIVIGMRGYSLNHPQKYAFQVLSNILGGGMSSRLFIQVRERRGLAYYVHTGAEHYNETGVFTTQSGVDTAKIDKAISVIKDEYYGLANGKLPITKEEMKKTKEYITGRLTLEFEDSRAVAGYFGSQEILKREILTPRQYFAKINAVTEDQVVAVAKDIFRPEKLNLAIIGPYKTEAKFKSLLQ